MVSEQNQSTVIDAIDNHKLDRKLLLKQYTALMLSGLFPSSFKKSRFYCSINNFIHIKNALKRA